MRHGWTPARAAFLALFALTSLARSDDRKPLPDSRLGLPTAPLLLLTRADVRADLKLTDEQVESAERTLTDLYLRGAALKGKKGPEAVNARRAIDQDERNWLDSNLSAGQRERLAQIQLQWEGPAVLVKRPEVADALRLEEGQRRALAQAIEHRETLIAQGTGRREADRLLAQQTLGVLTAAQKERWKEMLGHPFAIQTAEATARPRR